MIDPGQAAPVEHVLAELELTLEAILVTHHHSDHVGGVDALREHYAVPVYGPATEKIPAPYIGLNGGDVLPVLGIRFQILAVPGHTKGHIAFYWPGDALNEPLLFSGDTLFSAGCGRLFEGTPQQMLHSLSQLKRLPESTLVYAGHEYTVANLTFAQAVEPGNEKIAQYLKHCVELRAQGKPTLPTQLGLECAINPFLRTAQQSVIAAVKAHDPAVNGGDEVAVFAALREWKNNF